VKVAVTQPNYLPWLGYFDLLDEVDCWVCLDNVALSRRSFVVRNRVKLLNGDWKWLSLPISYAPRGTSVRQARLAGSEFANRHCRIVEANYRDAPFYADHVDWLKETLEPRESSVAAYSARVVRSIAARIGVSFEFHFASSLAPELRGSAQDKILQLCEALGGVDRYYGFATGVEAGLYRPPDFAARGIRFLTQDYDHPTYPQLGVSFVPYLSVLDLLLNVGPNTLRTIRLGRSYLDATLEILGG
jgi:hypothetical protein